MYPFINPFRHQEYYISLFFWKTSRKIPNSIQVEFFLSYLAIEISMEKEALLVIHLKNIYYQRGRTPQLNHVNWDVTKGEHWCLLGLNGSGKTTLLNIITGYIFPQEGDIEVLGGTFGRTNIPKLRTKIGIVSESIRQRFQEGEPTLDVVLSGKFASISLYEKVTEADKLQAEQLLQFIDCLHLKTKSYGLLSQGEKQRVLIARALMAHPKLLILDEPCNGLDFLAREHLLSYIEKIAAMPDGPTIIFVTHHIEEVAPCFTHALLLRKGAVFSSGPLHEQLTEENLSAFFQTRVQMTIQNNRRFITQAVDSSITL